MERRSVAKLLLTSSLSGCFSELYLPVVESGHCAPRTRAEQKSLPGPKQAEVRTWSCCWWREWSVPPNSPELLILPSKISSCSVNQSGELIVGVSQGKWHNSRRTCECGDVHTNSQPYINETGTLQWVNTANFFQSSLTPLKRIWQCVYEQNGTMNSQAPLDPDKELG